MVYHSKPVVAPQSHSPSRRRGAALASALFAIMAASILTAGVHYMTRVDIRTTANRESAARALMIAEAGAIHALAIMRDTLQDLEYTEFLRGPDTTSGATADDSLLIGRTLSSGPTGNDIPAAGRAYAGGTYTVRIIDDPADTDGDPTRDSNSRVIARCTGFGPDGARAQLDVVIGGITMPGFVFDGPLNISGSAQAIGRCGGVHANGAITIGGSNLISSGPVSSTSTVTGSIKTPGGATVTPLQNQPAAAMPELLRAEMCRSAGYHLTESGDIYRKNSPTDSTFLGNAIGSAVVGFKRSGAPPLTKWTLETKTPPANSYCIDGNLEISGGAGDEGAPARLSIYASGSVSVSGNPYMVSFDADSMLIYSGGDLKISGNPKAGLLSYGGAMYAKYQCDVSGNPTINGQMICDNEPSQPTSTIIEWATANNISGNPQLSYNCNMKYASTRRYMSWVQTLGPQ